jgi:hypothetical protein
VSTIAGSEIGISSKSSSGIDIGATLDTQVISRWLRQTRHRAKANNIYSDITLDQVIVIVEEKDGLCAYCDQPAATLDLAFPLHLGAPHVPANVLPVCQNCKAKKGTNDISWMFNSGIISKDLYVRLLQMMLRHAGHDKIRDQIRLVAG